MVALPSHSQEAPAPAHVAIIMDGNGRWAKARGLPRTEGHRRGIDAARKVVRAAADLGIGHLTLYGFSTENWKRPKAEVDELMGLLRHYMRSEAATLHRNGVRLRVIGDRARLAPDLVKLIAEVEAKTRDNAKLTLVIALSYGSRHEIVDAVRSLAAEAREGTLDPDDIDEAAVNTRLATAGIPDPDLVIRTSGEQRLSNFLLWQCAYSELMFVDTYWPDFGEDDLADAVREFQRRERRYGASGV